MVGHRNWIDYRKKIIPIDMINPRTPAKATRYSRKDMQFPHITNNKLEHTP
jgi:hypothetical protein